MADESPYNLDKLLDDNDDDDYFNGSKASTSDIIKPAIRCFVPTKSDLIWMIRRCLSSKYLKNNMFARFDLYADAPSNLLSEITPFIGDSDNLPFYLVYTPTREKTLETKCRDVGGELGGYWEARGIRNYVVDESGILGSYLSYSFKKGTLDNKECGKQNTPWKMIEYQNESELKNDKNYRMCKITCSSTYEAYKELATLETNMDNAFDLVETCQNLGRWVHELSMNQMQNVATETRKAYLSLIEEIKRCGNIFQSQGREQQKHRSVFTRPKSKVTKKADVSPKLTREELEVRTPIREMWKTYPVHEENRSKWAKTAEDFYFNEKTRLCYTKLVGYYADKHFWGALLGDRRLLKDDASGDLCEMHINGWVKHLMDRRTQDDRWTIVPSVFHNFMMEEKQSDRPKHGAHLANGTENPWVAWWEVDQVFIPINIATPGHWFLAVLDTRTFKMTVYDSLRNLIQLATRQNILDRWSTELPGYLDLIGFWKKSGRPRMDVINVTMEHANDVPQQSSSLGDCGVFLSMFMEKLANGESLELKKSTDEEAMDYRHHMAKVFYNSRDIYLPKKGKRKSKA